MPSLHIPFTDINTIIPWTTRRPQVIAMFRLPEPRDVRSRMYTTRHDVRPAGAHHFQTFRRVFPHEMRQVPSRQQTQRGHNVELRQETEVVRFDIVIGRIISFF